MSQLIHDTLYRFNDWWFSWNGPGGLLSFGAICSWLTMIAYKDLPHRWRWWRSSRAHMHTPATPIPWWLR